MAQYVKIKSNDEFLDYRGSRIWRTTDEAECYPYDLDDKNDLVVINHIIHNQFMINQAVTLIPVKVEG